MKDRFPNLRAIVDELDSELQCVQMDFESDAWRKGIPSEPGWYLAKTNAPVSVLEAVERSPHEAHTDLPQAVKAASGLRGV